MLQHMKLPSAFCLLPLCLYELQAICLMMSEGTDELQTGGRPFEEDTRNESVFTFGSVKSKPSAETLFFQMLETDNPPKQSENNFIFLTHCFVLCRSGSLLCLPVSLAKLQIDFEFTKTQKAEKSENDSLIIIKITLRFRA